LFNINLFYLKEFNELGAAFVYLDSISSNNINQIPTWSILCNRNNCNTKEIYQKVHKLGEQYIKAKYGISESTRIQFSVNIILIIFSYLNFFS